MKYAFTIALLAIGLAAPAHAGNERSTRCFDCPAPRPHYDSQETIRTTRDVDHSRVINTQSVVPASRQFRETNHLVVRHNKTRNVGVVRHNHTIVERDVRYVRRGAPAATVINLVVHNYRTTRGPHTDQPVVVRTYEVPTSPRTVRGARPTRDVGDCGYGRRMTHSGACISTSRLRSRG
jgi:hypothetical protein